MNYCIVIFPSKEVQDFANSYRKRYDPDYTFIQPHLPVMESKAFSDEERDRVIRHLERVSREIAPFTIRFDRFSTFYPSKNIIYLGLSETTAFIRCYRKIVSGILEEARQNAPFTPHLPIGKGMGNDELQDILSSLRKIPVDFSSRIDRIHLMYQTENKAWTAHQTFLLQGKETE